MNPVAELRFRRIATFALGVSNAISAVADAGSVMSQIPHLAIWWWVPTMGLNLGGTLAFLVLPWVGSRAMRPVTLIYAFGNLALLALVTPAAGLHSFPDDLDAPWPVASLSSFAIAAALTVRVKWAWVYLAVEAVAALCARWLASVSGELQFALDDVLVSMSVTVPFVLIVLAILRTGRQLDVAAAAAIEAARRDAAGAAAALERRRVEMLAHDDILYTLRASALGFRSATTTPATLARASLARLDQVEQPDVAIDIDVVTQLRFLTSQFAPDAEFDASEGRLLPPDVAEQLLAAAGEALRNSVTYASTARRTVRVWVDQGGVRVVISDDGPGFRVHLVPAGRLGVTRSIIERMRSVPGGSGIVHSAPGRGTTVELGWAP